MLLKLAETAFGRSAMLVVAIVLTLAFMTGTGHAQDLGLTPRAPMAKMPSVMLEMPEACTGRLRVKFMDNLKARPSLDGGVLSLSNVQMNRVDSLFSRFGLTAIPAYEMGSSEIAELLQRAAERTGRAQPDLEGVMLVSGPRDRLQAAARALNELPDVEWVVFDTEPIQAQPRAESKQTRRGGRQGQGPIDGAMGKCCFDDGTCDPNNGEIACIIFGGAYGGDGTNCAGTPCAGACCTGAACTIEDSEVVCTGGGGTWQGPLTACAGAVCGPPITSGKCCQPEGGLSGCMIAMDEADCITMGGVFGGMGTNCSMADACAGACCAGSGVCTDQISEFNCINIGADWQGTLQLCVGGFCFSTQGRCCMEEGGLAACSITRNAADCEAVNGLFGGAGTTCASTDSCAGACCLGSDCMQEIDEASCSAMGEIWFGPGTQCNFDCLITGKCCFPDGSDCLQSIEVTCIGLGGRFGGAGTTCFEAMPCIGACCMADAVNPPPVAEDLNSCLAMGGDWQGALSDPAAARCSTCCVNDVSCIVTGTTRCAQLGGQWRDAVAGGNGDMCPPEGCGACCTTSMSAPCRDGYTAASCMALGGAFVSFSAGLSCVDAICGLQDACCLPDGTCQPFSIGDCAFAGGTFLEGLTCTLDFCRQRVCCLPDNECELLREDECMSAAGTFNPGVSSCEGVECEDQCGDASTGNCFASSGNETPFCNRGQCCAFICSRDPFCCDPEEGQWDDLCAAQANLAPSDICGPYTPHCPDDPLGPEVNGPDPCQSPVAGSCFDEHLATPGCNIPECCDLVCSIDPTCCSFRWDAGCAGIAAAVCTSNSAPFTGPTPDYSSFQGYKTATGFQLFNTPPVLLDFLPIVDTPPAGFTICDEQDPIDSKLVIGYSGEGLNMSTSAENFTDLNGNGWWDEGEPFEDVGDGLFFPSEPFTDDGTSADPMFPDCDGSQGNGVYDGPEIFTDSNFNGQYDPGEPWIDRNCNNMWDPGEAFLDIFVNGIYDESDDEWDPATQDVGLDGIPGSGDALFGEGDGSWTPGEVFSDYNGNGVWDAGIDPLNDINSNGIWDPGEPFTDSGNMVWDPPGGIVGVADQLLNGPLPVDATGLGNITDGQTFKVGVIDAAYWPDHEDLGNTILEPNQTMILIPQITNPDHGTAVLGVVSAVDNGIGMTGMVPAAESYFYPTVSVEAGAREQAAWLQAISDFGPGDVLISSEQKLPPFYNLNNDPSLWVLFRLATDLGVTVCVAAGNDCVNLDNAPDFGDSGALVVGATSPGLPHYRLRNSNYCTAPSNARGNIVHINAWGENVATTGYGVLPLPDADVNRSYTPVFGGTSAATPQIGGVIVMLQALAKQFYGIPIPLNQIRSALNIPGAFIPPQRLLLNGGFQPGGGCGLDVDPEQEPHRVGSFPDLDEAVFRLIADPTGGFSDSPLVEDIVVVKGQNVRGNRFSIKGSDDSYLEINGIFSDRNDTTPNFGNVGVGGGVSSGSIVPQVDSLTYPSSGQMTDVVIVARNNLPSVGTMIVANELRWPPVFGLLLIEAYDWAQQRWAYVDFQFQQGGGPDQFFTHTAASPQRFVNPADNRILVRQWFLGFPALAPEGGAQNFTTRIDLVNVFVSEEFGVPLP